MPTSGTYAFTVSRDDVINAALRTLGAYGAQDTVPVADITNCAQALNILVKTWVMKGMPLWCVETFPTPMIVGQLTYDLSLTSSGGYVPKKLTDAFLRNTTNGVNNDVSLTIESRYDYNTLGNKLSPGVPNQLFYNPNISSGVATPVQCSESGGVCAVHHRAAANPRLQPRSGQPRHAVGGFSGPEVGSGG